MISLRIPMFAGSRRLAATVVQDAILDEANEVEVDITDTHAISGGSVDELLVQLQRRGVGFVRVTADAYSWESNVCKRRAQTLFTRQVMLHGNVVRLEWCVPF